MSAAVYLYRRLDLMPYIAGVPPEPSPQSIAEEPKLELDVRSITEPPGPNPPGATGLSSANSHDHPKRATR